MTQAMQGMSGRRPVNHLAPAMIEHDEKIQRRKVEGSDGEKVDITN